MPVRKRLFCVLLTTVLLFSLIWAGILDNYAEEEEMKNQVVTKDTITIWYSDENLTDYINSMGLQYYEDTDVRVEAKYVEKDEFVDYVNQASVIGKGPDLYITTNDDLEMLTLAGLASVITDPMKVLGTDAFSQGALNAVTYDYNLMAYPFYFETSVFLYNKTHLNTIAENTYEEEQVDEESMEEFSEEELSEAAEEEVTEEAEADSEGTEEDTTEEAVVELTAEEVEFIENTSEAIVPASILDIINFADSYKAPDEVSAIFKWDVNDIFYNYFFVGKYLSIGGEFGDDYEQINIYNADTMACLSVYQQLNQFFSIDSTEVDSDDVLDEFINGEIIFTIVTTDAMAKLEEAVAEGNMQYEYGIARIPALTETYGSRSLSVTDCVVVNGYSEHKDYANEFAEYLTYNGAANLYARTGKVACRADVEYDNAWMDTALNEYASSISLPKMLRTGNFWIQLEVLFSRVWEGEDINLWLRTLGEQVAAQVTGKEVTLPEIETVEVDLGIVGDDDE